MTEVNNKLSFLTVASITASFTLMLPMFYGIGYFYDLGYFSVYGFTNRYFIKEASEYFINSFVVFTYFFSDLLSLIKNLSVFKILTFLIAIYFLGILLVFLFRNEDRFRSNIISIRENLRNNKYFQYIALPLVPPALIVSISFYTIVIMILVILVPFLGYQQGTKDAEKAINNFTDCTQKKCVYIINEKKP